MKLTSFEAENSFIRKKNIYKQNKNEVPSSKFPFDKAKILSKPAVLNFL